MAQSSAPSHEDHADYTDPFSFYGKAIIDDYHDWLALKYRGGRTPIRLPPAFPDVISRAIAEGDDLALARDRPDVFIPCPRNTASARVGIIGAGVGGLYAAMMLESLDIEYEILEASERVGGRLYTQPLSQKPHDYIDVGAMRFPKTPMMKRTFHLFDKLTKEAHISVIPYVFKSDNSTLLYNDVLMKRGSSSEDPTKWDIHDIASESHNTGAADFKRHEKKGWELMMRYDRYSTRAYMSGNRSDTKEELDALKHVLDSLAFEYYQSKVTWWCVDGGSQVIADEMVKLLNRPPVRGTRVRAIAVQGFHPMNSRSWYDAKVKLSFANGAEPRSYGHVISTVTLPCLRTMDLTQASLTSDHRTALRTLRYGPAVKIGVKFKVSWWADAELKKYQQPQYSFGPIIGGQTSTDRMSTVLMVSYCWTEDANRLSAPLGDASKEELKDIVLRDLTAVHGFYPTEGYEFLKSQWEDHFAWSWSDQPDFMGAFGFFGPGQFSYIYKHMTQPAALGRLHFAGETLSVRHAWVVGALDASWRAVYEIICTSYPKKLKKFKHFWGSEEDWTDANVLRHVSFSIISQKSGTFERDGAGVGSQAEI